MKLEVQRSYLTIIPESAQDEAYIEEVLGLKQKDDKVSLVRQNTWGTSGIAYLKTEIEKAEVPNGGKAT